MRLLFKILSLPFILITWVLYGVQADRSYLGDVSRYSGGTCADRGNRAVRKG